MSGQGPALLLLLLAACGANLAPAPSCPFTATDTAPARLAVAATLQASWGVDLWAELATAPVRCVPPAELAACGGACGDGYTRRGAITLPTHATARGPWLPHELLHVAGATHDSPDWAALLQDATARLAAIP